MSDRLCSRCDDTGKTGGVPCQRCWPLCRTGCTAEKLCDRHQLPVLCAPRPTEADRSKG